VLSIIAARKILTMAGVWGIDVLCTYGGHMKEEVEAKGPIEDTEKKVHAMPHPVTSFPEWKQDFSSILTAIISTGGVCSNGSMMHGNVIKVFWALLCASTVRCKASEGVFAKSLEALKTDTKLMSVVENWLNQSESQAALIKKAFRFKSHGKRQAADGDLSTSSSETSERRRGKTQKRPRTGMPWISCGLGVGCLMSVPMGIYMTWAVRYGTDRLRVRLRVRYGFGYGSLRFGYGSRAVTELRVAPL
jgi:hypothetical protein